MSDVKHVSNETKMQLMLKYSVLNKKAKLHQLAIHGSAAFLFLF